MKENFLKKQADVIEDLRSMRSELKNLLIKYPDNTELITELENCRNFINLNALNNIEWIEKSETWLKNMKIKLEDDFKKEKLISYCFGKPFPELVE